ncbi:hypothetical protein ACQ86O_06510 [Serratia sp. L9]|uniref:hypothetical protein n=1 Tax=Serratia sp. L9 TaxID=3423946 RepID=UPI003D678DCA
MMTWTVYCNPVADMVGPWFLAFYLLYCLLLMWLVSRARRRYLRSYSPYGSGPVSLPAKVDPYYVAWLKGGIDQVLMLVMMRLSYKGLLTAGKSKEKTFTRPQGDIPEQLNRLERWVLSCFESGHGQKKGERFLPFVRSIRNLMPRRSEMAIPTRQIISAPVSAFCGSV